MMTLEYNLMKIFHLLK